MLKEILVPLDESPLAECVLPHTIALATAFDARVTLIHVLEKNNNRQQFQIDPLDWQLRKAEAQAYLDGVKARLQRFDISVGSILLEGSAAERIIEYAHDNDIDLIIVSTHGRSGLSGWNVSSVVQKVILRGYSSVMIVRAYQQQVDERDAVISYGRILVPLDGSQRAECALPMATTLARECDAELLLAHIVRRPEMFHRTPLTAEDSALLDQLVERNLAEAEKYLNQLRSRLSAESQTHLVPSENVTTTLHQIIDEEKVDLVMLSAHGTSGEKHQPYGSVTTNLISYGKSPLLIIQDLAADEIEPTPAEVAAKIRESNRPVRTENYAQSPS